ncbi:DUF2141 domain-containing protein [uncultured Sphingomonas sp.]|uniref:DUF2141 domain-containing protein n=1 Tax=uncultured Sphingomonas sp. TaxID=158754 RepID=UPI0025D70208|nr:DUF2141 domain-containing protein [uncultured Sphingomonas sp.]
MRRVALAVLALATLPGAMPTGTLDVRISDLRSTKGVIRLCLTADPKNFPGCTDDRNAVTRTFAAGTPGVRIAGLGRGDYAVSVIHDENNNAKLDTFAGIPREGFGFSRNPAIRFGPPKFSAAEFPLAGDVTMQQVRIRYLL